MLRGLWIENYRSLRSVTVELGQLTVVTGPNGSGKSNLYQALALIQAAADGRFKQSLLQEGGMPSALWAGPRRKGPVRMRLAISLDDLSFELVAGLAPKDTVSTPFVLDPEIKKESLHFGPGRRTSTQLVDRGVGAATVTSADGERDLIRALDPGESILSQISEPARYPELTDLRRRLGSWRFYHHFDTSKTAPVRRPQPGVRTNVLAATGDDLGAAIATIQERGDAQTLHDAVAEAFPNCELIVENARTGEFAVGLAAPGLQRPLTGGELSDGQLRFLCLATALATTRPPELLVLNEPETSLHPSAVMALAPLIIQASQHSQVWVTTHDTALRDSIAAHSQTIDLGIGDGETHATRHGI